MGKLRQQQAEGGVQLIGGAVGGDAGVVLGDAGAVAHAGLAAVAGARGNPREIDDADPLVRAGGIDGNAEGLIRQAAVVSVRGGQVCLVSSRSGKRWVVPKGMIEPGKSAGEVAMQEAWEEAGLVGLLRHEPVGSYVYQKDGLVCHVIVFVMNVTSAEDLYPEVNARQHAWLSVHQALGTQSAKMNGS